MEWKWKQTIIQTSPPHPNPRDRSKYYKSHHVKYNLYSPHSHATILAISDTGQVLLPVENLTVQTTGVSVLMWARLR